MQKQGDFSEERRSPGRFGGTNSLKRESLVKSRNECK